MDGAKMKVGIYNRWLHTIGGGEKHMCAIAEALKQDHRVDILTYQPVDKDALQSRLDVDLQDVTIRYIPDVSNEYASHITADYDLWINASYMSSLPSKASKSWLLVYFPTPFDVELTPGQKLAVRFVGPLVKKIQGDDLRWLNGFYQQERFNGVPYRWTGGKARFWMANPQTGPAGLRMRIGSYRPLAFPQGEAAFFIDGKQAGPRITLPRDRFMIHDIEIPPRLDVAGGIEVEIRSNTFVPAQEPDSQDTRELGTQVAWVRLGRSPQFYLRRLADLAPSYLKTFPKTLDFLETYDRILANSKYTQHWISNLWARNSEVLFPPVDVQESDDRQKANIILSVGRFFRGSHNKKQIPMIRSFKNMCDGGLTDWEYHLCGGTHREAMHQEYLSEVMNESCGYPVFVHPDCSHKELRRLYGESKLYWHAAGLGEDPRKNPERFEHFGITTVEAMAAGSVPVVIGKAGQLEIVQSGRSGFLWDTVNQLQRFSLKLIGDEDLWQTLSLAAIERARVFSSDMFRCRINDLMGDTG